MRPSTTPRPPAASRDDPHRPALRPVPPQTVALTRRNPPPRQRGGAIGNYQGTTTLSDCTLSSNQADNVRPSAAPLPLAASCDDPHHPALLPVPPQTVALTRRNPSPRQYGGALYNSQENSNYQGTMTLSSCTLSSNHADKVRPSAARYPTAS